MATVLAGAEFAVSYISCVTSAAAVATINFAAWDGNSPSPSSRDDDNDESRAWKWANSIVRSNGSEGTIGLASDLASNGRSPRSTAFGDLLQGVGWSEGQTLFSSSFERVPRIIQ